MISAYELACGCQETFEHNDLRASFYREHNTYHLKALNANGERGWYVFDRADGGLKKARKAWTQMKKILKNGLPWPDFILGSSCGDKR